VELAKRITGTEQQYKLKKETKIVYLFVYNIIIFLEVLENH